MGCSLPGTLVFDYPTTSAIVEYLYSEMVAPVQGSSAHPYVASIIDTDLGCVKNDIVAISAMSGRLPSNKDLDAIKPTPLDRWDNDHISLELDTKLSRSTRVQGGRFGGFVDVWDSFDAELFAIAPSGNCIPLVGLTHLYHYTDWLKYHNT